MNRVTSSLVLFLLWSAAWPARAESPATAFDAANLLYGQGKYAEAAGAYENILRSGSVSAALCFNLGNAHFKSGRIGRAIAAYRQAGQLAPRDPDVRANLQFARNQVQGPTLVPGRWDRWLGAMSLNEWTWLSASAVWVAFLLLAVRQLWPESRRVLRSYAAATGAAAFILCACLACALQQRLAVTTVVVSTPDAVVHTSPLEESASVFTAHDGAEFRILDRKGDWAQVSGGARRIGWLKLDQATLSKGS